MKRCRVMLIIQMILMYLAQIPFYVALLLIIDVIGAIMFKHKFKSDEKSIQTE